MEKKKLLVLVPIFCAVIICTLLLGLNNEFINNNDAIKFKEEYEVLNNKDTGYGEKYKKINISIKNPVIYSNYDEIIDIIKHKTGIIYLGFPECPWCRTALPVLFDVLKDNNINKLNYLNILNERDSFTIEDNQLVYSKNENGEEIKGTKEYHELLNILDEHLSNYTLELDGKIYETGEKRIYAPSVIFVKNGNVLGIHVSTIDSQNSGNDELTEEQYKELYDIYERYIEQMNSNSCKVGSSC